MAAPYRTPKATAADLRVVGESSRTEIIGWESKGYLVLLSASSGETVRAEPFEAIELRVGVLFGDEDEDDEDA